MMATSKSVSASSAWVGRLRFVLATAIVWAGLHFVAGGLVLPHGLDRPVVLSTARSGPLAGVAVIGLLWGGAALVTVIVGSRDRREPLMILGLALALWAAEGGRQGGTFDAWLVLRNETLGPPTGGPYWTLLGDYAYLLLGIAGAHIIGCLLGLSAERRAARSLAGTSGATGRPTPARQGALGLLALLIATVAAGVAVFILAGPAPAETLRGQVYFAVLVGFLAGVFLARRVTKIHNPLWYWPAPFLLGIAGLLVAGFSPGLMLPREYQQLNIIPAWGLTRALPVEMVGVGLIGTLWILRPHAASEDAS